MNSSPTGSGTRSAAGTLTPPGQAEEVRAASALVLAPHHDDEVLGCGGLIARLTAAGAAVRVLFLSDSGGNSPENEQRRADRLTRRRESAAAAEILSLAGADHLELPDGRLDQHLEAMAKGIRRALLSQRPELLLAPSPHEVSSDHRAAWSALHQLLAGLRSADPLLPWVRGLEVLAYEINHPLYPDLLVDISDQVEIIERAMACYASQQRLHDYSAACLGLSRFRTLTLGPGVEAAEAYRRLRFEDFQTRGRARLIAEMGGVPDILKIEEGPLIAVIVRTKDRPELLAEALASLATSTYRRAEVVVVNDGGARPPLPDGFPLPLEIVDLPSNRGRAAAANAGLAAVRGDYVTFLDDDDLAEPEHLATLAGLVRSAEVRVAYSDAAVGVYELGDGAGWRCVERRLPYSRDFDAELLLFDNYIPFNTLLIERQLISRVGELDEDLPFFEDWDFLIRLAQRTPFHHLAKVTCEYRQFRGGAHHVLGDSPRARADFLEMKGRVIGKHALSGERADLPLALRLARVIDRLRAEYVAGSEEVSRLTGELRRYHDLNGQLSGIRIHQQVIEESERRARAELRQREGEILAQQQHIGAQEKQLVELTAEIERLSQLIRAMESTKAWRLHQWWQRRRP